MFHRPPSFRRRACPVPRYGAGIQSPVPANTRLSTERLSSFSSSMVPVATGMAHCYENRLRQTRRRGNPCGCPFPAPTRFHPLMWPLQGHGDSEERSDEESTISPRRADRGRQNGIVAMIQPRLPVIPLKIACVPPPIRHSGEEPAPYHDTGQESSLPSLPTLDYRRKDCRHFHLPWCRWQPAWLIDENRLS